MGAPFDRSGLFRFRITVLALLTFVVSAVLVWRIAFHFVPPIERPVEQPVPFSHKHHVADIGLDCRYCHASVERSSFAGMPATETCMSCHSQLFTDQPMLRPVVDSLQHDRPLRWKRVHDLPDFVYFNHAVHIHGGVGCSTCHGRVDQMPLTRRTAPLTMQWCLHCHRDPAPQLVPRERVFDLDWQASRRGRAQGERLMRRYRITTDRLTDCSVCHR